MSRFASVVSAKFQKVEVQRRPGKRSKEINPTPTRASPAHRFKRPSVEYVKAINGGRTKRLSYMHVCTFVRCPTTCYDMHDLLVQSADEWEGFVWDGNVIMVP